MATGRRSAVKRSQNGELPLKAFLTGEMDGSKFRHVDHVRVGFELLRRRDFPDALLAYAASLKDISTRAGNPGAYHETITVAFLALIAERQARGGYADFDAFISDNSELLDKSILERWYENERLFSDIARKTFIMPNGDRQCP